MGNGLFFFFLDYSAVYTIHLILPVVAIERNQNEICFFFFFFHFIFPPWLLFFLSPPSPPIFDSLHPVWWSDSGYCFRFTFFFFRPFSSRFLICCVSLHVVDFPFHDTDNTLDTYIHTYFLSPPWPQGFFFVFLLCCCRAKRKSARNWNNPLNRRPTTTKPIAQPILY